MADSGTSVQKGTVDESRTREFRSRISQSLRKAGETVKGALYSVRRNYKEAIIATGFGACGSTTITVGASDLIKAANPINSVESIMAIVYGAFLLALTYEVLRS